MLLSCLRLLGNNAQLRCTNQYLHNTRQYDYELTSIKWHKLILQSKFSSASIQFLPRCMECSRGIAMGILSVCLSVCPSVRLSVRLSVKRVHCDKTEESYV